MGVLISNKHAASLREAAGKFHKDEPGTEYSKGEIVVVNSSTEPGIAIKDGNGNVVLIGIGDGGGEGTGKIPIADNSLEYVTEVTKDMRVLSGYRVKRDGDSIQLGENGLFVDKSVDCGEYK